MDPSSASACRGPDGALVDTGQGALAPPDGPSSGEGEEAVAKQELLQEEAVEGSPPSECPDGGGLAEQGECNSSAAVAQTSVRSEDCPDAPGDVGQEWSCVKPKIVVELEDQASREDDKSSDEDMDPLVTVDDTESQISDLINFDTVSYDVMHHPAAEDDDEKSIATVSSLSCDMKLDSPLKLSEASNSSSLVNLLDLSVKETSGLAASSSSHILGDVGGSATSSCPSSPSPSFQSSKTTSSAVDENMSEQFMKLQAGEGNRKVINCDYEVLSQEDIQSEDASEAGVVIVDNMRNGVHPEQLNGALVSLGDEDCSPESVHEESNESQTAVIEPDSSDAQFQPVVQTVCDISLPTSTNLSLCCDASPRTEIKLGEATVSPQLTPCLDDDNDCDIFQPEVDNTDGSEPLKVPDNVIGKSLYEHTDSQATHEDNVISSMEMEEIQNTTEDSESLHSQAKDKDFQNLKNNPNNNTEENSQQSLTISQSLMQCSLENGRNDISPSIAECEDIATVAVSSTSEEKLELTSTDQGAATLQFVPTSNGVVIVLQNDGITSVVSSTTEAGSTQIQEVDEGNLVEEHISSSTSSLVFSEHTTPETSEKIFNVVEKENADDSVVEDVRTHSPVDTMVSVSRNVTSEDSTQLISCDNSNETTEIISLEAASILVAETSSPTEPLKLLDEANTSVCGNRCVESDSASLTNDTTTVTAGDVPLLCLGGSDIKKNIHLENVLNPEEKPAIPNDNLETALILNENADEKTKRPTTLPDINPINVTEEPNGMNFSEFLQLFNSANSESSSQSKQYKVAALDEAQQMASFLVDDILQMAILKAEEKLRLSKSLAENRVEVVQAAHSLVDDVVNMASIQVISVDCGQNIVRASDLNESESGNLECSVPVEVLTPVEVYIPDSAPALENSPQNITSCEELSNNVVEKTSLNLSEIECQSQPSSDEVCQEVFLPLSNTSSEVSVGMNAMNPSKSENVSEDSSPDESLIDLQSKENSTRNSSTDTGGVDSVESSQLTISEVGLRSEASLFIDGVLEEAVKKYEETSSSDSSPVKLKSLALDSEFCQDEDELATPCGEMLTEHFMDFESGRNVSVFCSIPESGSEDHLLAYDRIAHTIGNREVDSDNGKSVSVFRIEEDVFYEIQRASTCTSVFESVEEEDEDMVDTTLPVEDRPEKTMQTSVSFPSYDKTKLGRSDDPFSADCDAFEDAVGAFLTKERLAHNELRNRKGKVTPNDLSACEQPSGVTCRALVLRHPEYDISNSEEKKRMAEKWANGGESEVPDTPEMREKERAIREALDSDDDVAVKLCRLALTEGGLINDALRREAWPRMLGLDPTLEVDAPSLEDLKSHPEYGQVVLDVNRSLKRFPPDIPKDRRETLQDKLTRLIMYVISKHPHLRYYQGYHDVAVTFLLVVGESVAFQIMERLSTEHLSDCMQPTMERTSYLLHFIYPLLHRLHPVLADYLERSEVGTMFCLPWFLTWFGHSLDRYQDVVRLYDHFLASPPLAPLYVAAVLVAHRADEVLAVDCDMAAIHALLSHIPDSLPLEILLRDATDLYMKFPPEAIEREVEERFRNEQDMRVQEMKTRERVRALRRRRGHGHRTGSGSWQLAEFQDRIGGTMMVLNRWIPPWVVQQQRLSMRLLFASATFFVGFYVYSRGGDMLPYP